MLPVPLWGEEGGPGGRGAAADKSRG